MKKFLLVSSFLFLCSWLSFGQIYHPIVRQNSSWIITTQSFDDYGKPEFPMNASKNWIYDSIVYDSLQYYYLLWGSDSSSSNLTYGDAHLLREDSAKQVFVRFNNFDQPTTYTEEFKIYDFGMKIGDTAILFKGTNFSKTKTSFAYMLMGTDTITISGQTRIKYSVADTSGEISDYWIEGIGSPDYGLLSNYANVRPSISGIKEERIECFWDDKIYWRKDTTRSCAIVSVNENSDVIDPLILYPNPTSGIIHLSEIKRDQTYEVLNTEGRLIKKGEFKENDFIDIRNAPPGLYFVRILGKENSIYFKVYKE